MKNIFIFSILLFIIFFIKDNVLVSNKIITIDSHIDGNSYIMIDSKEKTALLVDANVDPQIITKIIKSKNATLKYVLVTHHHHAQKVEEYKSIAPIINSESNDENLIFKNQKIKVIKTPGHTKDGACFLVGDILFTGDTLFRGNIGRSDFEDSNYDSLMDSIKNKLLVLDPKTKVYPGHDQSTTIDREIEKNPMLKPQQN